MSLMAIKILFQVCATVPGDELYHVLYGILKNYSSMIRCMNYKAVDKYIA